MKTSRPPLLMILIVVGLLGCFFNMFIVISPAARNVSNWYPVYISLSTLYVMLSLGGLGMMRKWGIIVYSPYAVINQLVYLYLGTWNLLALALPLAIMAVGWFYYRKMT